MKNDGDHMSTGSVDSKLKMLYWLAFFFILGLALIYVFAGHSDSLTAFSNLLRPVVAGIALVASGLALRHYWENLDSTLSRIWLCFAIGMTFWFLSELSWAIQTLVLSMSNPYPSIANVYRLVGYCALFLSVFVYLGLFHNVISGKIVAISAAVTLPTSAGIIPSILLLARGRIPTMNLSTVFVTVAYPIFDLLLFAQAMLGLLVFTMTGLKGRLKGAWLLLNAGILMNVFGDLILSYTNLSGTYYAGHPLELFFQMGYIFFALAFHTHTKEL
ncbi:MAG TPA: hypothetical protein VJ249_01105 [Candidatus Bathyarchaeia archaeon]|nr:hypothetical protein [Candidatus Bathyarchaeia archaeon]